MSLIVQLQKVHDKINITQVIDDYQKSLSEYNAKVVSAGLKP